MQRLRRFKECVRRGDPASTDLRGMDFIPDAAAEDQRMPAIARVTGLRIHTHPTTDVWLTGMRTIVVAICGGEACIGHPTAAVVARLDGLGET